MAITSTTKLKIEDIVATLLLEEMGQNLSVIINPRMPWLWEVILDREIKRIQGIGHWNLERNLMLQIKVRGNIGVLVNHGIHFKRDCRSKRVR